MVTVFLLQRWLTSPVRRLSQGKADGQKKPPIRTRRRDNRQELTTPLTGNAQTVQKSHNAQKSVHETKSKRIKSQHVLFLQKLRKEESGQSGGEEEPEEESHTPLPPPMQIIKDPNNPEVKPAYTERTTHCILNERIVGISSNLLKYSGNISCCTTCEVRF